jgi:hypothetical protein
VLQLVSESWVRRFGRKLMCSYFVIVGMAAAGDNKGKKPIDDNSGAKSTWEKGGSFCRKKRRVILPGPPVFTVPLLVGPQ